MYKIVVTPEASRALEKLRLSQPYRRLIIKAIDSLATDPFRGQPLRKELKGFYKLRVGDYRIVYDILREIIAVVVIGVGHRKNIYSLLTRRSSLI